MYNSLHAWRSLIKFNQLCNKLIQEMSYNTGCGAPFMFCFDMLLWLGNAGKHCNCQALSERIKIRGFRQTQKFLGYVTQKDIEILLSK